jgi:hypothetical protein
MSARLLCLAALLTLSDGHVVVAAAAPAALDDELAALLDLGFAARLRALGPAEERYAELQQRWPAEPRLEYAWALVQLKHRQYAEAAATLAEVVELAPDDLQARRALIWAQVMGKQHAAAVVEMDATAQRLADGAAADDEALRTETARFLGRMFGFLEGPGAGSVQSDALEVAREALEERLDATLADEVRAGRNTVLERFDELTLHQEQARDEARDEQEDERDRVAARLADEQTNVDAERAQLESQAARARSELDETLAEIERRLAPLNAAFAQLEVQAAEIAERIRDLEFAIEDLLDRADQAEDAFRRDRLLREADRLAAISDRHRADYTALDRQARAVNAERAVLESAHQDAVVRYEDEQQRIDRRVGQLDRRERRIARDERELERPATGNTPRVRSLSAKATALATYDEFPLAEERRRLSEASD